jgi:2-dehydro-3-deoxy-D-arabinonate dehydratase
MTNAVWRIAGPEGVRWAVGPSERGPKWFLNAGTGIDAVLRGDKTLERWMSDVTDEPVPSDTRVLAPIESQDVWAAGVTFKRSQTARREESQQPDHYDLVYEAERPELFFKATAAMVRGPDEAVTIRSDSNWNVPEPEVALLADSGGSLVAITLGNDMSSRDIEGQNPLYLPQAKIYDGSCSLGPCLVPIEGVRLQDEQLSMRIERDGEAVFADTIDMSELYRTPEELLEWLFRALSFPTGVVLLTGTGLVPESAFSLRDGDSIDIDLSGRLSLRNVVGTVGVE